MEAFTHEQEARLRQIIREEIDGVAGEIAGAVSDHFSSKRFSRQMEEHHRPPASQPRP